MSLIRSLILVAFLALPVAAQAQTVPPTFAVPAQVMQHVVTYLASGGTHAEGAALVEQLSSLVQQQINAAQKAPEPKAP